MLKLIKWLLGLLFALVLLLVAAIIVLPLVINPNDYKEQITNLVKEQTGRDLSIQQDLQFSVFPWIGIETGKVVFGNAPGFGENPFAQIEQLGLKVKLLPLLQKRIEVDTLVLNGLQLNLIKNKQGITNWADLQQTQNQTTQQPEENATADTPDQTASAISFSVEGIQISDAQIRWQDQQARQTYQLNRFNLIAGGLYPGAQSPIQTSFEISSNQPPLESTFNIKSQLEIGDTMQRFGLNNLNIKLDAKGPLLPQEGMQLSLSTQAAIDLAQDRLMLKDLTIQGPEIALTGDVTVQQLQTAPATQANLQLQKTNLKQIAKLFGVVLETQKASAMTQLSAEIGMQHVGNTIKLDPLTINLDESKLKGHIHVLETAGPTIHTRLNVDQINIDHYLPPSSQQTPAPAINAKSSNKATAQKTAGNPFAALRTLDLQAEARIGKLTISKMHLQDIVVKAVNKNGVLQLKPVNAKLYQGQVNGAITLNAKGKQPNIHAVKKLSGVQIGDLLTDLMGEGNILGQANADLNVRLSGLDETAIRKSLNGQVQFKILDGAYKGVNIAQLIRETGAALGLNTEKGTPGPRQTDFSELSGSANIKNGVIRGQDLSAKSPLLRIDGKGQVNLPKNTIDYLLTTELVVSLQGQGGKSGDDLSGVPIPVKITGSLNDPSYRPELSALISKKAKQRIKQETEKVKQQVKQEIQQEVEKELGKGLNDEVKDALKGLFGR